MTQHSSQCQYDESSDVGKAEEGGGLLLLLLFVCLFSINLWVVLLRRATVGVKGVYGGTGK